MRLRAPTLEDLDETYAVLEARDIADLGRPDFSLDDLRDAWRRTETDLAVDVRVVEDPEAKIIGYAIVEDQGAFVAVHPDEEGRGAGSLLIDWVMQRERERGQAVHRQWIASTNRTGSTLLATRGYELARSNFRMVKAVAGQTSAAPDRPSLPGVALRPYRVDDLAAMHALDQRAFADDPGYVAESITAFREEHLEAHDSAPDLSRVASEGEGVLGFILVRRWTSESVGYVDVLAVDPDHQGRGIGRALLLEVFEACADAGLSEVQLGVSSVNPRALNLYQTAGMTIRFQADIYERPIG